MKVEFIVGAASLYDRADDWTLAEMVRLDELSTRNTTFVKLDVEGFEPRVLEGAPNLLKSVRPAWLVEVAPERPKVAQDVRATLQGAGYDMYWFFSPFLTRKRPRGLDRNPPMRGDISILAVDGPPPWKMNPVGDAWPGDVSDFPYLMELYGFVSGRGKDR